MDDGWRDVEHYPGYQVSREGQVRTLKRGGKLLAQVEGSRGYMRVNLYRDGKAKHFLVHRLVAAAWLGPIPPGKQVNHRDGAKSNNTLSNLEIITAEANRAHALRHGFFCSKGEANPRAKLKESDVVEIRRCLAAGVRVRDLAIRYDLSDRAIYLVWRRKTWSHVD